MEYPEKITAFFKRVLRWLALASPGQLLLVYAGTILAFALLYTFIRRDFYHPYVKFEQPVVDDKQALGEALSAAFTEEFKKNDDLGDGVTFAGVSGGMVRILGEQDYRLLCSAEFMVDRWRTGWPQGPYLTAAAIGMSAPPNNPCGRVALVLFLHDEKGHSSIHFTAIPLLISAWPVLGDRIDENENPVALHAKADVDRRAEETNLFGNDAQDREAALRAMQKAVERLRLSPELRQRVDNYTQAERGFPHSATGTFSRMLYLSWITITTVGYGDIVPMSTRARMLVGVEATFGIILLGLLVNSVIQWASALRKEQPESVEKGTSASASLPLADPASSAPPPDDHA
jgi:hypothetical protein